jgi:hypothetical protein
VLKSDTSPDDRAGITIGLINDIPTCEVLVNRITSEAEEAIQKMHGMISIENGEAVWQRSQRQAKL